MSRTIKALNTLKRVMLPTLVASALSCTTYASGIPVPKAAVAKPTAVASIEFHNELIVKYTNQQALGVAGIQAQSERLQQLMGEEMIEVRQLSVGAMLYKVDARMSKREVLKMAAALESDPAVEYAVPNKIFQPQLTPNDSRYNEQWHYFESTAGINVPDAWDVTTGAGAVVGVLDTGFRPHADLAPNISGGYDFISSAVEARDGNGRDSNAQDQGDWTVGGECGGNPASNSSWHGTHVAGTVGAVGNNGTGVTGVAFDATIVPVRVLGRCGGSLADIMDAMEWAAGLSVPGVPNNPTPVDVINMSLGGGGTCSAAMQNVINNVVAAGTTVVVAAGNSNVNASGATPASCSNILTVAALDRQGNRAFYSNFGNVVDISAPGGETATQANGVLSTLNTGTTTPAADTFAFYQGTSMATPHVAGVAALLYSAVPGITPAEVMTAITSSARPVPGSCTGGCGAGLIDATAALAAATGGGGTPPPPPPPSGDFFENTTDFAIPDNNIGGTFSPLQVTRTGGSGTFTVNIDIKHTFIGDLVVQVVLPGGATGTISNRQGGSADDLITSVTFNGGTIPAEGEWRLVVSDRARFDTGFIDSWSVEFQ